MKKTLYTVILQVLLVVVSLPPTLLMAQDDEPTPFPDTGVYVTTQDYSSLRVGPGVNFDRITVLDPAVTLPAVGRTNSGRWIQVVYEGQLGWIAAWLLVWSGDYAMLPIDGINPVPFVRRAGVIGVTTRETTIYRREIAPQDAVGTIPEGEQVELVGRLGSGTFFWLELRWNGELYWVGAWDIRITSGNYRTLPDTAYLYAYGRLVRNFNIDLSGAQRSLSSIENIWRTLESGRGVSCNDIPEYVEIDRVTQTDLRQEPIFVPLAVGLESMILHINTAITMFQDACGRVGEDFYITQREINTALNEVDEARRNYNIVVSLLQSLANRDPLLEN